MALAVAVALVGLGAWFLPATPSGSTETTRLEVWDHDTGRVAFAREIGVGATFQLEHVHSVTHRVVVETFSIADATTVALEELWFDEPGPNLPAGAVHVGEGVDFIQEDGAFRVLHHGREIGTLPLLAGSEQVDHRLRFDDERLRLLDVVRPGARVEVRVGGGPG